MSEPGETSEQERERLNTGTRPVADAHKFDEAALQRWLQDRVAGFDGPLTVRQFKGGQSNPTYQLITPSKAYVLRRKPPGLLLPSAHAVDREYRVLTALHAVGYPVARTHCLCEDPAVIGTTFYVMDMVEGNIYWDQTLPGMSAAQRGAIFRAKIETLARLHGLDHAAIGLGDFGKPGNYMARQIARWTRQYQASEIVKIEAMDRLIEWLPRTVPPQERTSIVHGDYRLDNMIFDRQQPRVLAVLDWELSTLGDPLADFTYLLANWKNGALAQVADLAALGIPAVDQAVEWYCELTGRQGLPDLNWYLAYNQFRLACIVQGIVGRVRDGTANSPQAAAQAQRVPLLATAAWQFAVAAGA